MEKLINNIVDFILSIKFYGPIITIIIGVVAFNGINKILTSIVEKRNKINRKNHKKEDTLINLIRSVIKYIIIIIVILVILEIYGINTTSILASLGIVGFVVGLALQDTMKNMLAGIFIIFDNRYNVGDTVKINDFTGEVLTLGLQTTKLKSPSGEIFTIQNSSITSVTNYTECDTILYIELGVGYNTNIDHLEKILNKLNTKVKKIENVKDDLKLLGVDSLGSSEIVYKISITCKPYTHFGVKRNFLKLVKETFDKEGIEIPYTQVDIHLKEEKIKKISKKSK